MQNQKMNFHLHILIILTLSSYTTQSSTTFNIINFGAKPDGQTDASNALLSAWSKACSSKNSASITIPNGRFLVTHALFLGPCNNNAITVRIQGTLLGPTSFSHDENWITFKYVKGLSILGGVLDAQGQSLWKCKASNQNCPAGATSLKIEQSSNILINSITLSNSEMFHMGISASTYVTVQGVFIKAPGNSPNTDGIHIQKSSYVKVLGSNIQTGDDCISIGEGTSNIWIEKVNCGPGHGISIGSLGESQQQDRVQNITVKSIVFTGTQNGVRIKTWGKPNAGFVTGVVFQNVVMKSVKNPILVDQNYCPDHLNCPNQDSGIKISNVMFSDIQGSSASQTAVKFDCSAKNPCKGMLLQNVKLTYGNNNAAQAYCKNVKGKSFGFVVPPSCL